MEPGGRLRLEILAGCALLALALWALIAFLIHYERVRTEEAAASAGLAADAPGAGEFRAHGAVDGVERFFAYRRLRDYPLTVYVGNDVQAVLTPYYRARNFVLVAGTVATMLLGLVALLLVARARERARFAEERERLMLELHDSSIQSLYAIGLSLEAACGARKPITRRSTAPWPMRGRT